MTHPEPTTKVAAPGGGAGRGLVGPLFRNEQVQWALLALCVVAAALHAWHFKRLQDFAVFYTAGHRAWHGASLYLLSDGVECFKYAPAVAMLFAPLSHLPQQGAALLWMLGSAACLVSFWRFSFKAYAPAASPVWQLLALLWISPYLRYLLALGQSDLVVLALIAASELLHKRRPFLSGALWGVCVLFKLPFLILLPLALMQRQWRRLTGLAVAVALGAAAPVVFYGGEGNLLQLADWRALLSATTPEMICAVDNQSVYGLVCRYFALPGAPAFLPLTWAFGAVCFCAAAVVVWRRRSGALGFAVALYLAGLLSPLGWRSNLVALLPLIYVLAARWTSMPTVLRVVSAGALSLNFVVGLVVYDLVSKDAYRWLVDHKVIGLLALCFVFAVLIHESRAPADPRRAEA